MSLRSSPDPSQVIRESTPLLDWLHAGPAVLDRPGDCGKYRHVIADRRGIYWYRAVHRCRGFDDPSKNDPIAGSSLLSLVSLVSMITVLVISLTYAVKHWQQETTSVADMLIAPLAHFLSGLCNAFWTVRFRGFQKMLPLRSRALWHELGGKPSFVMDHAYWGPQFGSGARVLVNLSRNLDASAAEFSAGASPNNTIDGKTNRIRFKPFLKCRRPGVAGGLEDGNIFIDAGQGSRRLMGKRGQDYARKNPTWSGAEKRLPKCYDEVLTSHSSC